MTKWTWIEPSVILAVHDEQIAEHGGLAGIRDRGLLDSALARPAHLVGYGNPDHADLAASYGFAIANNHPFIDGNKRTAFVAVELFLALNGWKLIAQDADAMLAMLAVAAVTIDETGFADWIRRNSKRESKR